MKELELRRLVREEMQRSFDLNRKTYKNVMPEDYIFENIISNNYNCVISNNYNYIRYALTTLKIYELDIIFKLAFNLPGLENNLNTSLYTLDLRRLFTIEEILFIEKFLIKIHLSFRLMRIPGIMKHSLCDIRYSKKDREILLEAKNIKIKKIIKLNE